MQRLLQIKKRFTSFVVQNKLLVLIILVAGVMRLWNIEGYMDFKGDEGRDMIVVSRFIKNFDLMFIGPRTSIGNMYLGPLYYYLISPALLFANFNPVGPSVFVALIGIVTVWLIWYFARELIGKIAANVAAGFYAISPVVIENSRDSWNPNVMPFFALLTMYSFWRAFTRNDNRWLLVTGVSLAFTLQSHYLGLLLLPTLGIFWLWFLLKQEKPKQLETLKFSFLSFLIFILLMSPIFIFDAKHNWQNTGSFVKFFTHRQDTVSAKPWNAIPSLVPLWTENISIRLLSGKDKSVGAITAWALFVFILLALSKIIFNKSLIIWFGFVGTWMFFGLVGLALLKQNLFDHYFGFIYPAIFLILGATAELIYKSKLKFLLIPFLALLIIVNLKNTPIKEPVRNELARVRKIDKSIVDATGNKKYNFGLIADRNYEEGYLYFLELWGSPVKLADQQHTFETVTDQLFVVCEMNPCNPTTNAKAEIAHFGMSKIEFEWEVEGIKIYKLVHKEGSSK